MAPSTNDVQGRRQKRQESQECPDFMYYDTAIPGCTPCDHLCDNHGWQGTTEQCKKKCYDYYMRSSSTLSTHIVTTTTRKPQRRVTKADLLKPRSSLGQLDSDKGNAILAVVVVILTLAVFTGIGYLIWRRGKDKSCCRRRCRGDEKTSVPCSEEDGLPNVGDSQKPLMGSTGPIRQVENCPQQELSNVKRQLAESGSRSVQYPMTFAEFGGAGYAVLDEQLNTSVHRHSTIPKEAYHDHSAPARESHVTAPKETFSEVSCEHLNTHSVRSEGEWSPDGEHDLSTS